MILDEHAALSSPESTLQFCRDMERVCREAGMTHFAAFCLRGVNSDNVTQTLHNATDAAAERLTTSRHWTVDRMLDTMRKAGTPAAFGAGAEPGMDIEGYRSGVAAIAHLGHNSYVLFFGHDAPEVEPGSVFLLLGAVQIAVQCAADGLAALVMDTCPLSERELQCLAYFVAQHSPKQTAFALGISAKTVEHHLERARVRLRVNATLAAATMAIRNGWLDYGQINSIGKAA